MLGAVFIFVAGVGTGIGLGYGLWGEPNWVGVEITPSPPTDCPPVGPDPTIGPDTNLTDYLDLDILELGKLRGIVQGSSKKANIFMFILNESHYNL